MIGTASEGFAVFDGSDALENRRTSLEQIFRSSSNLQGSESSPPSARRHNAQAREVGQRGLPSSQDPLRDQLQSQQETGRTTLFSLVTPTRFYRFSAESAAEKIDWIRRLTELIHAAS